ncbi:HAD family hydrolase [Halotalea alkalilenta]|uniref:HAD family hydrolase n=1 Tax=Halotalea alkalilenta TaxID=376489 RepID=UPI0004841059|nr:HAD-IA family hydrolase [Halotalea alkalilenta]
MSAVCPRPEAVLFDLDGTLVDTAPDLIAATNRLRREHDLPPLPYAQVRAVVSNGGAALVELALAQRQEVDRGAGLQRLLALYEAHVAQESRTFPGLVELVEALDAQGVGWGVVTNKQRRFAQPLLSQLALNPRVLVCADDLSACKPDPAPLLEAARRLAVDPGRCWYVGDHLRDMQAAINAGMLPVAALYGYLGADERPESWPAKLRFTDSESLAAAILAACGEAA